MLKKFAIKLQLAAALLCAIAAPPASAAFQYTDRSGTITTGGVSQTLVAAFPSRTVLIITHATTETEPLCVNINAAASCSVAGSLHIAPGGQLKLDSDQVITITAATTGHKFTAKEVGQNFDLTNGGTSSGGGGGGDASQALQTTGNASLSSIDGKTPALVSGRQPVDGSGVTQPVSATSLPLPTGAATAAKQPALGTAGSSSTDVISVQGIASGTAMPVSSSTLSTAANQATTNTNLGAVGSTVCATDTGSCDAIAILKKIAANQTTVNTSINTTYGVATATLSNVAASATNVTCVASNASRKAATIYNDTNAATLRVKKGATASTTSFTYLVLPGGTLSLPTNPIYTGIIDCIWSAAEGSARVTEE